MITSIDMLAKASARTCAGMAHTCVMSFWRGVKLASYAHTGTSGHEQQGKTSLNLRCFSLGICPWLFTAIAIGCSIDAELVWECSKGVPQKLHTDEVVPHCFIECGHTQPELITIVIPATCSQ